MPEPRVAAVIVSFNTRDLTLAAVASLLASRGVELEVWVVDNASSDGSAAAVRSRFPAVRLIELRENVGFGRGNNAALEKIDAPYVLLLNSDAALRDDGALARMVAVLASGPRIGVLGPRLERPDGQIWFSVRAFPSVVEELARASGLHRLLPSRMRKRRLAREFWDHSRPGSADWLTGACLLVRGEVLRTVGGFDPAIFLYSEDLDWCWSVREAGWDIVLEPSVVVTHHGGASNRTTTHWNGRVGMAGEAYVIRKHRGWGYLVIFAVARTFALSLRWLLEGIAAVVTRSDLRWSRSRNAASALEAWLSALIAGGAISPDRLRR